MNILQEIKSVGFINWFWFVFILKRNEFHRSLDSRIRRETIITIRGLRVEIKNQWYQSFPKDGKRSLAHKIDDKISNLNHETISKKEKNICQQPN
jgi:hypothetical protein